ncbi:MAG: glutathione S-transferase C-terminal domain-containing protein [Lactobacillus sp.]|jgi:putative glutathione S-transferase|nr:glutathione S-transferase C-terminal domain-containing protein [Lactobacillus sp.]MCI2032349.1 glutathione S-transferase C-terminal domain-containing protein [Lactobacillus sp.]
MANELETLQQELNPTAAAEAAFCVIDFTDHGIVKREVDAVQKRLIDAPLALSEAAHEVDADGHFHRQAPRFTTSFGDQPDQAPAVSDRYRLIVSRSDAFAHEALIVLTAYGLQDAIAVSVCDPIRTKEGWAFTNQIDHLEPVLNISYLGELYVNNDPAYTGRATLPALVDVTTGAIVNNDAQALPTAFATAFAPLSPTNIDWYPDALRPAIDALRQELYTELTNAVFEAGFANSQAAYAEAYARVFAELAKLDERLADQPFLLGEQLTLADATLFATLVRFDAGYVPVFHTNKYLLTDYKHLWRYARRLFALPAFGGTTDFAAIKAGIQLGDFNNDQNPYHLVSKGPQTAGWYQTPEAI